MTTLSMPKLSQVPHWLIILFVFCFPFSTPIASYFATALLIFYLASGDWTQKWQAFKTSRVLHLCVALFAWTVLAGMYSQASDNFLMKDLFKYKKLLLAIPVFFYMTSLLKTRMVWAYVAAEFFSIALSLYKGHGLVHLLLTGTFEYSSNFRIYIIEGVHIALVLFILLSHFVENLRRRLLTGSLIFILCVHSVFLNGRMSLISLLLSLSYFLFWRLQNMRQRALAFVAACLLLFTVYQHVPLIQKRVDRTVAEAQQAFEAGTPQSTRLQFFQISFDLFKSQPLLGHGPGSFRTATNSMADKEGEFLTLLHSHNEYLTLLSQYGLVGGLLFMLLVLVSLRQMPVSRQSTGVHIAYVGILLFLVNSLTDSMLYMEGFFFVYLIAYNYQTQKELKLCT
jgi:O-antigen ligase